MIVEPHISYALMLLSSQWPEKSRPAFPFSPKEIGAASNATGLKSKRRGLLCRFPEDRDSQRGTEEKAGSSGVSPVFNNQRLLEFPRLPWISDFPLLAYSIFKEIILFAALVFYYHQYTEAKTSASSCKVCFIFLPNMIYN